MYVIGISTGLKHGHHDGGACLLEDGKIIAASEEERFTLAKHARGELPKNAVRFCLTEARISIEDIDYVCSPLSTYPHYARRLRDYFKFNFGHSPKIELYDHHLCHAASTYFGSGYDEATVLCLDNSGDSSSGVVLHAKGNRLESVNRFERHNSLGLYYGMMTQYLGYQMTNDEYKVMGLASYGEPNYMEELAKILRPMDNGFEFNGSLDKRLRDSEIYTTDFSTRQECIFTEELEEILGPRRLQGNPLTERHRDIAASMQKQLEIVVTQLVRDAVSATDCPDVCLAGGVALNCKANMEVLLEASVRQLYVPPVPHDAGVALGAAMLKCAEHNLKVESLDHAYWGPSYSADMITQTLDQVGARYSTHEDPTIPCVEDLMAGRSIGWFQGRMEYGPRALGNRSIIANPCDPDMKNRINGTIKYREEFRPFCPSIQFEHQHRYFDHDRESPFMNVTLPAKATAAKEIPAVIHVDQTARLQSVRAETNARFHQLIDRFAAASGTPVLLNTSLNINEQPTVNGPLEALHTYFCSGLDVLYLENFRLAKSDGS